MARVIRVSPSPKVAKQCDCKHCGARIEYVPNDLMESHGRDYSGGSAGCRWLVCPNCGKEIVTDSW